MIKKYASFDDLLDKGLYPRNFEIVSMENNQLTAKYAGNHTLRQKDSNMEVQITQQDDKWRLNAPKDFYCNRVMFDLRKFRNFGRNPDSFCDDGFSGLRRLLHISTLEKGILNRRSESRIGFPYWAEEIHFKLAKEKIHKFLDEKFEPLFVGWNNQDLEAFEIPKSDKYQIIPNKLKILDGEGKKERKSYMFG